jgi:AAA domain
MHIIKATEAIAVEHPVFCVFGQPGIGKSTLGYSAKDPLLLDFDAGAHRAANRRDTLQIGTWADVQELMDNKGALDPYSTIVVDTVGRCLDLMTADIIDQNPKYARDGALTLQGFGVLKTRFRVWLTQLRAMGKDVVLLAHHKEEKDGDVTVVRPDIIGASYGEVMKLSDFVGFLAMVGKNRVLDFSPTDRWVGKNPAQWKPLSVPAVDKAAHVLAALMEQGRKALGQISEASAEAASVLDDFKHDLATYTTTEECDRGLALIAHLKSPTVQASAKKLLWDRVKELKFAYDPATKLFIEPPASKPNGAVANMGPQVELPA